MQMRMVHQILSPGMEHGQHSNLCAEMFWIGGDPQQRISRSAKQHVVADLLVL